MGPYRGRKRKREGDQIETGCEPTLKGGIPQGTYLVEVPESDLYHNEAIHKTEMATTLRNRHPDHLPTGEV